MQAWVLLIEALGVYVLVLFVHSRRHLVGLAPYYALLGGLTAVMSWVTDAQLKVIVGPVTFLVGSTVFFTALLLAVFVLYVFDGPREARTAISTVAGISALTPLILTVLHLQLHMAVASPASDLPLPSLRVNAASVLTSIADMVFLAVAWEFLAQRFQDVPVVIRTMLSLLGVLLLDVALFNTGAFAGTPAYLSILTGTLAERVVVALLATPVLWAYLHWQTRHRGESIRQQPILAMVQELRSTRRELDAAQQELAYRRRMMQQLHESEQRYRELIEHALEGILVVQSGQVVLTNPRAAAMLRRTPRGCLGLSFEELFAPAERERFGEILRGREEVAVTEFELTDSAGANRLLEMRAVSIQWHQAPAALIFLADVTERRRTERQLLLRANTDALTGLCNRPYFLDRAECAFEEATRRNEPLALITLDADHFKDINDRYGHPAGDAVLQHLARLLTRDLRDLDAVGRMGGEEFAVLLPGIDLAQARAVADRLRRSISDAPAVTERGEIRLTVSAGVAQRSAQMGNLGTLIQASDDALLSAKQRGRNRVEVAGERPVASLSA